MVKSEVEVKAKAKEADFTIFFLHKAKSIVRDSLIYFLGHTQASMPVHCKNQVSRIIK